MTRRDLSYILRERKRRAIPSCPNCKGGGTDLWYEANGKQRDLPCPCVFISGDFSEPDPLADEGQSDARELARERY